eukprot:12448939-Alexandrium_andersonii.AAC.1
MGAIPPPMNPTGIPGMMVPIPEKPAFPKPETVCPMLLRDRECSDPTCRAHKVHDPEAVRQAQAWKAYDEQCMTFRATAGLSAS